MPARVAALPVPGEDYESDPEPEDEGEFATLQTRPEGARRRRSRNCGWRWTVPGAAITLFLVLVCPKLADRDSRSDYTKERDEVYFHSARDDTMPNSEADPLEADLDAIIELPGGGSSTTSTSATASSTSLTSTSTSSSTSSSTTSTSTTTTTTTVIVRMFQPKEVALPASLGTVLGTALAVSLGVGLGLSGGLGIYFALGSLTVSVPDASAFSQNAQAIQAVKRTLARMAGDEVDETAVELVLPCVPGAFFASYGAGALRRRLQETINICFNIRVEGEDNSIRVCQRLSEFGPGAADRFLGAELPGGSAHVINWTAAPNPFAANPNLNIGVPPGFNPSETGVALG